jgi:pyrroloquinoline quinone biosynthesis protein B
MGRLTAIVLGAAAGGGFPQWNCRCDVCSLAWKGDERVRWRTQTSLAVSADGERWVLLNAAPDLRAQLNATAALHPRHGLRSSPIVAAVLTGAEIDQISGLLNLRERGSFALIATAETLELVRQNPMFDALVPDLVRRRAAPLGAPVEVVPGMTAELFTVPGKVPLYVEGADPETAVEGEANVGIEIVAAGARLAFVPGAAKVTPALRSRLERADVVLFDGTLFSDDEMIRSGTGTKTGRRMGHMPMDGPDGSLNALADIAARRIYIHINNTNPVLVDGSLERRRIEAAGFGLAEDGQEIVL